MRLEARAMLRFLLHHQRHVCIDQARTALRNCTTTFGVTCHEAGVPHLVRRTGPSCTKGRVALVGDAGYAPSFLSGQGTSLAVVGAYQLAAALAAAGGDPQVAFPVYEQSMRHYVEQNQRLALKASGGMIPRTALGLWLRNRILGIVPLILPLIRRLHLSPGAGLQRAANSLTLAELPSPLSARGVPADS